MGFFSTKLTRCDRKILQAEGVLKIRQRMIDEILKEPDLWLMVFSDFENNVCFYATSFPIQFYNHVFNVSLQKIVYFN